jgi:hypothetical protein
MEFPCFAKDPIPALSSVIVEPSERVRNALLTAGAAISCLNRGECTSAIGTEESGLFKTTNKRL